MNPLWITVSWALWAAPNALYAVAQGREDRWLFAFLGTSGLLLLDVISLGAFAAVVLKPKPALEESKWRRRARMAGVMAIRFAPWAGLAFLLKSIPPKEAPLAHLLGWVTLPWVVFWATILPRIVSKKM